MSDDSFFLGHEVERRAAELLRADGIEILARNVRTKSGEIDIVAREGACLVMVEVRHRRAHLLAAWQSIGWRKRRSFRRAALEAAIKLGIPRGTPVRHDVVLANGDGQLVHLRGALQASDP